MGGRWGPHEPPPEAYSRVTDPGRFTSLHAYAEALVKRLETSYDVTLSAVDHPDCTRAVRVQPRVGGPLVVGWTDFPGVVLADGHWGGVVGPVCGCDACDESLAEVTGDLDRCIEAYVSGHVTETLSRDPCRYATTKGPGQDGTR